MKIVINPKYSKLRSFVENIPDKFEQTGELVYTARNQLKSYSVEGYELIVKRYKKPHYINRIAYSFVRPPKAERAYQYALKLLELDLNSPEPIAYIIENSGGLLEQSYFISIYEKDYQDVRDLMSGQQKDEQLLKELAGYIACFHNKGVLHLDMSPGNILYKKDSDVYKFTLIDINRMQFLSSISKDKRYKSFKRLAENQEVLAELAGFYALASGINKDEAVREITRNSYEFFNSRKFKSKQK